jgi:hypothetical protein
MYGAQKDYYDAQTKYHGATAVSQTAKNWSSTVFGNQGILGGVSRLIGLVGALTN